MPTRFRHFSEAEIKDTGRFEDLGRCYYSPFGVLGRNVLIGDTEVEDFRPPASDALIYMVVESQEEFTRNFSASAKGSGSFGLARASAKLETKRIFSTNSYSCYLVGYTRVIQPHRYLDLNNVRIVPETWDLIESEMDRPDVLERKIGDEVVTGITIGAEILIKIEIQTRSQSEKEEVSGSLKGSFGSNSGSLRATDVQNVIKRSKSIRFMALGDFPQRFVSAFSPQAVDDLLLTFNERSKGQESIQELRTRPLGEINQLARFDIINRSELRQRHRFIARLNSLYQDYEDWRDDIQYVISAENRAEFKPATVAEAKANHAACGADMDALVHLYETAQDHWYDTGTNGSAFELSKLMTFRSEFPIYPRIEPTPPRTPAPRQKPERDAHNRNDGAHGGGR